MEDYFSIGELSRYQNISKQTLIFYDKIGLFCPAYTDPDNGYRYYSASQLDYLDTICILKKIGFSLDEIKAHMQNYTIDHSILALRKQLAAIERGDGQQGGAADDQKPRGTPLLYFGACGLHPGQQRCRNN